MGADRAVVDSFAVGDEVLLSRLMGQTVDPPARARVVSNTLSSLLYSYAIECDAVRFLVMNDWIRPYQFVIQEVETPWD